MSRVFASLIQSDFTHDGHGNLEAVIQTGGELRHWFRDGSRGNAWSPAQVVVPAGVAGAGALIQSDFSDGEHGNFEVVVPVRNASGASDLWHYFRENSDVSTPWRQAQRVAENVTGPASLIQGDFSDGEHGNFEVVVPVRNASGASDLWHYFRENSDVTVPWQRAQMVAANVAGAGCIIQSDFAHDGHGNFEVVVPVRGPSGGAALWHYFHDNSDVALPWQRAQMVAADVMGAGVLIQSDFSDGEHGNFEVVAAIPRGEGAQLRHFFRENSDVSTPWRSGQFVTDSCGGWGCLIQGDFGQGSHGNFELLVEECNQSIVGYWHPNSDVALPWLRHRVLLGEPYPQRLSQTRRIAQLTGEYDRTVWDGTGQPPYAHNRTESAYQIRGTDLGVSFPHRDRTYFLFGDTWRVDQPRDWTNLDLVAYTTDPNPRNGLDLAFFHAPPRISGGIAQREFEVPLDGVSDGQSMFVFFSTDHVKVDGYDLMGRSVLTRCDDDGFSFAFMRELSRYKFVNVSVQRAPIDSHTAAAIGLPGSADVLWIWGSGRYRSSDVYLAVTPYDALTHGELDLRYFSGSRRASAWSGSEEDATALFCNGSVGELSVRWNAQLGRWLATFNSDNPRGILLHSAPSPWGPWTQRPVMVFDPGHRSNPQDPCSGDGYGAFMHVSWAENRCDHVQDDMFDPGQFRDDEYGGEYGPYQISNYAEDAGNGATRLYFAMSTWNPYQAMLMSTVVTREDLGDQ